MTNIKECDSAVKCVCVCVCVLARALLRTRARTHVPQLCYSSTGFSRGAAPVLELASPH